MDGYPPLRPDGSGVRFGVPAGSADIQGDQGRAAWPGRVAAEIEAVWLGDLRYRFWEAHCLQTKPTSVELHVATQVGVDGYYIAGADHESVAAHEVSPEGVRLVRCRPQATRAQLEIAREGEDVAWVPVTKVGRDDCADNQAVRHDHYRSFMDSLVLRACGRLDGPLRKSAQALASG